MAVGAKAEPQAIARAMRAIAEESRVHLGGIVEVDPAAFLQNVHQHLLQAHRIDRNSIRPIVRDYDRSFVRSPTRPGTPLRRRLAIVAQVIELFGSAVPQRTAFKQLTHEIKLASCSPESSDFSVVPVRGTAQAERVPSPYGDAFRP